MSRASDRNTPPQGWLYKADISWILNHKKMAQTEKASRIMGALAPLKVFKNHETKTVLTELVAAGKGTVAEFENALDILFNTCDYYSVWLSS